eukprot:TRINITY_DN6903_c0_g1_i4.p1 TRINITY_DN6903_c0_g1~~TRINITY_DN6903_c0_g1_i4.p1  ORF type:complete len:1610 (+),score=534.51 TRINITY_DN6903_c0_g1_i4:62-4831(+)
MPRLSVAGSPSPSGMPLRSSAGSPQPADAAAQSTAASSQGSPRTGLGLRLRTWETGCGAFAGTAPPCPGSLAKGAHPVHVAAAHPVMPMELVKQIAAGELPLELIEAIREERVKHHAELSALAAASAGGTRNLRQRVFAHPPRPLLRFQAGVADAIRDGQQAAYGQATPAQGGATPVPASPTGSAPGTTNSFAAMKASTMGFVASALRPHLGRRLQQMAEQRPDLGAAAQQAVNTPPEAEDQLRMPPEAESSEVERFHHLRRRLTKELPRAPPGEEADGGAERSSQLDLAVIAPRESNASAIHRMMLPVDQRKTVQSIVSAIMRRRAMRVKEDPQLRCLSLEQQELIQQLMGDGTLADTGAILESKANVHNLLYTRGDGEERAEVESQLMDWANSTDPLHNAHLMGDEEASENQATAIQRSADDFERARLSMVRDLGGLGDLGMRFAKQVTGLQNCQRFMAEHTSRITTGTNTMLSIAPELTTEVEPEEPPPVQVHPPERAHSELSASALPPSVARKRSGRAALRSRSTVATSAARLAASPRTRDRSPSNASQNLDSPTSSPVPPAPPPAPVTPGAQTNARVTTAQGLISLLSGTDARVLSGSNVAGGAAAKGNAEDTMQYQVLDQLLRRRRDDLVRKSVESECSNRFKGNKIKLLNADLKIKELEVQYAKFQVKQCLTGQGFSQLWDTAVCSAESSGSGTDAFSQLAEFKIQLREEVLKAADEERKKILELTHNLESTQQQLEEAGQVNQSLKEKQFYMETEHRQQVDDLKGELDSHRGMLDDRDATIKSLEIRLRIAQGEIGGAQERMREMETQKEDAEARLEQLQVIFSTAVPREHHEETLNRLRDDKDQEIREEQQKRNTVAGQLKVLRKELAESEEQWNAKLAAKDEELAACKSKAAHIGKLWLEQVAAESICISTVRETLHSSKPLEVREKCWQHTTQRMQEMCRCAGEVKPILGLFDDHAEAAVSDLVRGAKQEMSRRLGVSKDGELIQQAMQKEAHLQEEIKRQKEEMNELSQLNLKRVHEAHQRRSEEDFMKNIIAEFHVCLSRMLEADQNKLQHVTKPFEVITEPQSIQQVWEKEIKLLRGAFWETLQRIAQMHNTFEKRVTGHKQQLITMAVELQDAVSLLIKPRHTKMADLFGVETKPDKVREVRETLVSLMDQVRENDGARIRAELQEWRGNLPEEVGKALDAADAERQAWINAQIKEVCRHLVCRQRQEVQLRKLKDLIAQSTDAIRRHKPDPGGSDLLDMERYRKQVTRLVHAECSLAREGVEGLMRTAGLQRRRLATHRQLAELHSRHNVHALAQDAAEMRVERRVMEQLGQGPPGSGLHAGGGGGGQRRSFRGSVQAGRGGGAGASGQGGRSAGRQSLHHGGGSAKSLKGRRAAGELAGTGRQHSTASDRDDDQEARARSREYDAGDAADRDQERREQRRAEREVQVLRGLEESGALAPPRSGRSSRAVTPRDGAGSVRRVRSNTAVSAAKLRGELLKEQLAQGTVVDARDDYDRHQGPVGLDARLPAEDLCSVLSDGAALSDAGNRSARRRKGKGGGFAEEAVKVSRRLAAGAAFDSGEPLRAGAPRSHLG